MLLIEFEKDSLFYNVNHIIAINRVDKKIKILVLEHESFIEFKFDTEEKAVKAFNRFYDLISAKSSGMYSVY